MPFQTNASIKNFNTFGIEAKAAFLGVFTHTNELGALLQDSNIRGLPRLILGGGSNVLFTGDFKGAILKNDIGGIELIGTDSDYYYVKAGAGESWHPLVLKTLEMSWYGLENLSLIPGRVGASPMQNIGAYGIEIKDRFHQLEAYEIATGKLKIFTAEDCAFGYRESVFKNALKNKFIITSVTFKLLRAPDLHVDYGAIKDELRDMNITTYTAQAISDAVVRIRSRKLPNPAELGNAGSFFKNPTIERAAYLAMADEYPDMPHYDAPNNHVKLAAGWLIEKAGWKGKRVGNCGVHAHQALVLVNYGGATGPEIYALSGAVRDAVLEKFGVELEREVNLI